MSIFSTPSSTDYYQPVSFPGDMAMRKKIATAAKPGALERMNRAGETYQGPLVAALSDFEQQGLQGLQDWLGTDLPTEGTLYKSAADEIQKTLSGEAYDPVNSDYYKAYRNQVMRELSDAQDALAARASAGDKLFGGGRLKVEGDLQENAVGNLAVLLGQMQERERERRLGAVPQALQLAQYEETAPMQRIAGAFEYGQLPRMIQQAQYDADYQEWVRALNDLGIALDTATGLATYQPTATIVQNPSETKGWVKDAASIAALVGTGGAAFPFLPMING
jgi:hypothetical protein